MIKYTKRFLAIWILLILVGVWTDQNEDQRDGFFYLNHQSNIKNILEKISEYRHFGLISQLDKDMGDTLQRTGSYYTLLHYLGATKDDLGRSLVLGYAEDFNQLTVVDGVYRRSNDPLYWGFDSDNCSRDQIFAAQSAIVTFRDFSRGRALFGQFLRRGFLNQNVRNNWAYPWQDEYSWKIPDIPTPSQISLLLRGLGTWAVYPAVFVLDAFILLDVEYFRKQNERQLWDYDIKLLPAMIAANSYMPTIWSRWGLKLYLAEKSDIAQRIQYYNQDQFNGISPLAEIYNLALDKMKYQLIVNEAVATKIVSRRIERSPSNNRE